MTSRHPPVEDWATDFDHTDPAWVADPYPIWEDLRQRCPVAHSDRYGGTWLPVTHELVSEVAYDTEHFTSRSVVVSEERPGPDDLPAPIGLSPPITSDPPFHAMARGMLLPAFGPRATAALEPFTRDLCRELLAETEGRASFDAAIEYARHIPVRVIVRFLGFPQEDADRFRRFIRLVLEEVNMPAEDEEREAMFGELDAYMDAQIDDHIAHPRDDLTSFLIEAEIGGSKLSREHVRGTMILLMIAGIDTTWSAIGAALWHLARHPARPAQAGQRPGSDGHRRRGVPARLRAGHDGAPGGQGLRLPRAPAEGGRLAAAPVPGRQPGPQRLREPRRGAAGPGKEPARGVRPGAASLPRIQPGPDGTPGCPAGVDGPLPGLRADPIPRPSPGPAARSAARARSPSPSSRP